MKVKNLFHTAEVSKTVFDTAVDADGRIHREECRIVNEHMMDLYINEQLVLKLVCTPSNLTELVVGRMISEGYIISPDEIEYIYICSSGKRARVYLKDSEGTALKLKSAVQEEPTCCTDNKVYLKNVNSSNAAEQILVLPKAEWKSEWIFKLANEFSSGSRIHRATQGTHSCYLSVRGEILFACEDIGRHNALDKAIGYAVMNGLQREICILFTTGRVPTDMVRKVVAARIPVLVTKAVPTDAAIEMAQAYNLTLICKAWPDRYEIFNAAR